MIGHITQEVVRIGGAPGQRMLGGAAYYAGVALGRLGLDTAVVTKTSPPYAAGTLRPLNEAGVTVYPRDGGRTTYFENTYAGDDLDQRTQRVVANADPFEAADLEDIAADTIHLGPLTAGEMPLSFLGAVSRLDVRVSLDVQGFVRAIQDGRIVAAAWGEDVLVTTAVSRPNLPQGPQDSFPHSEPLPRLPLPLSYCPLPLAGEKQAGSKKTEETPRRISWLQKRPAKTIANASRIVRTTSFEHLHR